MKIIVQYSGGKDSQATLIWACKKYGSNNITAVYCDTKWENPLTCEHIETTTRELGAELVIVSSKKYEGMLGLAKKKKRFPSSNARFCTEELKIFPFADYLLDVVNDHVLILQGIRSKESASRAKMNAECRYFKYYLEAYGYCKKGKPKYLKYRKKEVLSFIKKFDDSMLRPFFDATGQEVIDYIIKNGQQPNPLYGKGFKRVGCFPCIMSNHRDIKQTIRYFPETLSELVDTEIELDTSFFSPGYIPARFCSKSAIAKKGKNKGRLIRYPTTTDVTNYLDENNGTYNMFEKENKSCMSLYNNICE